MSDYIVPDRRRSKKDLWRKRRQRVYKRGGVFRSTNVQEGSNPRK